MFYKIPEVDYVRVSNLDEALQLLSEYGREAKILAGGTDLIVDLKTGRYRPKTIIDISGVKDLRYIIDEGDRIRIGALTKVQEIVESPIVRRKAPLLSEALSELGSWQIRCVATVGGNLCNASPAADAAPPLLVHEAKAKLTSKQKTRTIKIEELITGPRKTILQSSELLHEVEVPYDEDYARAYSYIKLGRRNAFTLSVVSVAVVVKVVDRRFNEAKVALNSVAPTPVRVRSVESFLAGNTVSKEVIEKASELVLKDIAPISDVRASAEYRRHMSKVLVRDALLKALTRGGWVRGE